MKRQPADIVRMLNTTVELDMNMDSRDFAQARLMPYMEEKGYIAAPEFNYDGTAAIYTFIPWTFTQTHETDEYIRITGPKFAGETLLSLFESGSEQKCQNAVRAVCTAMEAALSQNITLPMTGPAGTIVAPDGTVLFLPQTLFTRAAESRPQVDYSQLLGCWIHPGLEYADALRFTQAVYVYRYASGILPYPLPYTDRRHEDYFDKNFLPLQFAAPGINPILAIAVNRNLGCRAAVRGTGKNKHTVKKIPDQAVPIPPELITQSNADEQTTLTTAKEREIFITSHQKRIKRIRFIRKNASGLKIAGIAAGIIVVATAIFISDKQSNPTPKGLTAREVCESLYSGMHTMNITLMQQMCNGSGTKNFIDTMSGFYVTSRVRESMEQKSGTVTPEQWLYFKTNTTFWIFGLTDFRINGIAANTRFVPYTKKDKPSPVVEENGIPLKNGDTQVFNVSYYFIRNAAMDIFAAGLHHDTVTLTYKKDSWYVTDIQATEKAVPLETEQFKSDYLGALEKTNGYVPEAVDSIKKTYFWLPTYAELIQGAITAYERFSLQSAFDVLVKNGLIKTEETGDNY